MGDAPARKLFKTEGHSYTTWPYAVKLHLCQGFVTLLLAEVKMKLLALKNPRATRTKYYTYRLRDQSVREEFFSALANRYEALYNGSDDEEEAELDVEQEWSKIKEMYSSTCEEVLGKVRRERKAWRSEDTWKHDEERRALKAKLEAAKTRKQNLAASNMYNKKNHEVKRSCRRDKMRRIDEMAQESEIVAEQRDMKKVYDTTRLLSGRTTTQSKPIKDTNGVVLNRIETNLINGRSTSGKFSTGLHQNIRPFLLKGHC